MRYRPMPSRTPPRRRQQPMTSKTIRLIERLARDSEPRATNKTKSDSRYCD